MKPKLTRVLSLVLLVLATGACAETPVVLVVPFDDATGKAGVTELAAAIPDLLAACYTAHPDEIRLVDRTLLGALIDEQDLSFEGYIKADTGARIGAITGAGFLLRGSLTASGQRLTVQALLFDIETTVLVTTVDGQVDRTAIARELCEKIAVPLLARLRERPRRQPTAGPADEPELQQLLIAGLNDYYNGRALAALAPFLELVRRDPQDANGNFWLGRCFYAAGLFELARVQLEKFVNRFPNGTQTEPARLLLSEIRSMPTQ